MHYVIFHVSRDTCAFYIYVDNILLAEIIHVTQIILSRKFVSKICSIICFNFNVMLSYINCKVYLRLLYSNLLVD